MDTSQLDRLTRGVARVLDRRSGLQGLFALGTAALGVTFLGSADDAEAGKKCTPDCGECQQCKKGKCHRNNHGKKRCKKGKCKAETNGTTCTGGTCQAGVCQPTPLPCDNACTGDETCVSEVCCLPDTIDLQEAVGSASAGDTLRLCPGTWTLTITVFIDRDLTLIGAGAGATRLDGNNAGTVLQITAGTIVTLRDLTVTKGNADFGGGIYNSGTLTLRDVSVTGNTASLAGGGIHNRATLTLQTGSSVSGNSATNRGGGINNEGTLTLKDGSSVTGNTSRTGGGVYSLNATMTMETGSSVSNNTATNRAGGIQNGGATLTLKAGSHVTGNTATIDSGGILNNGGGTVNVESTTIVTANTPNNCTGEAVTPPANCVG